MYGENPFLFFWCKSVLRFIAIPENNAKIQHRSTDFFALFSGIAIVKCLISKSYKYAVIKL